jgi:uncharacterized membrane protein YeaQ/YmgE (transglycosylase-associated protein family)|tara:strand:- start:690 stop:1004 length:315 start_codon:yes stop_codon:yes gene_type:complete
MYSEKNRSRWWYLLPILAGLIGAIIAYFAIRRDDMIKARTCICIAIVSFGIIGGVISYFILRKYHPSRAKLFLYIGIAFTIFSVITELSFGITENFEQDYTVNM